MIVGIVSGRAESAFVNDWMDRDKKIKYSRDKEYIFPRFSIVLFVSLADGGLPVTRLLML